MSRQDERTAGADVLDQLPCTASQERCWFITQLQPQTSALNVVVSWDIRGAFTSAIVEAAFRRIIARHEIFRTRLVEIDDVPMQEILRTAPLRLSVIDLSMLAENERQTQLASIAHREAHAPLDLAAAPLLRPVLVWLSDGHARLLITAHQAVFDGWSIRVLGRELGQIMAALLAGETPDLPDLPLQYGDYALWQRELEESGGYAADADFWAEKLRGAPYFEIEPDFQRPSPRSTNAAMISEDLPRELSDAFDAAAKQHGVSLFSLGVATVAAMLNRRTEKTDLVLGTQVIGRHDVDLESLIGVFINNLALRFDASGDPAFAAFAQRAHDVVAEALSHDRTPFHRIVRRLNAPRDPSRMPLISTNVIVQRAFMEDCRYGDIELKGTPSVSPGAVYDLSFQMIGRESGWRMSVEYNTDLFSADTARDLLESWQTTLHFLLAHPEANLSAIPKVAPAHDADPRLTAVERALTLFRHVQDAAVTEGPYGLRVFVTPSPDFANALDELPDLVLAHLDTAQREHAVAEVRVLASVPRRPDGVVDAARLPAPRAPALRAMPAGDEGADAERALIEIWKDLLGADNVTADSNFFDLGGDSMLALRMVVRVQRQFGQRVDVAALFDAPTVRAFARQLPRAAKKRDDFRVVAIQPQGDGVPVFSFNNTIMYAGVSRRIGAQTPFFGVQPYDPTSPSPLPVQTFEEIVSEYVALVRSAKPHGPYVLVGLCVAGAIAFEAAQQLKASGEDVPLLIMMDTWAPQHRKKQSLPHRAINGVFARVASFQRRWARHRRGEYTLPEFFGAYGIVRRLRLLEIAAAFGVIKEVPPLEDWENRWFLNHLIDAADAYTPKTYEGDVVVYTSSEIPTGRLHDPQLGWRGIVNGRLEVKRICEGHMSFGEGDSADAIAARVRQALHITG